MSTINENNTDADDATATSGPGDQTDDQGTDTSNSDTSQTDDGSSDDNSSSDDSSSQPDGPGDNSSTDNPSDQTDDGSSGDTGNSDDSSGQTDDGSSDSSSDDSSSQADNGSSDSGDEDNNSGQSDDNSSDSSGDDSSSQSDGSSDSSSDDSGDQSGDDASDNNNDDSSAQTDDGSGDNIVAQNDQGSGQSNTTSGQSGTSGQGSNQQSGTQQSGASANITKWLNDDYPVRMLKVSEALQIVNYLITQGSPALQIDGNKVDQTNMTTMFTGNGVTQKIVKAYRIKPDVINGIQFKYLVSATNPKIMGYIDNVDPRMIVFLYKFTKWLKDTWGPANNVTVKEVHHIGIGHGNEAHLFDCHNTGRAMDLGGIAGTKSDGTAFTLNIYSDWGQKPAVNTNGKACFRLAQSNGLIYNFARDFDAYAMNQCQDKSQGQDAALSAADLQARMFVTGQPTVNSFIIHPDYPDAGLRQAHQNHFHVQIGPTNYESAPPL
jgi:hypothetical protein